MLKIAFEGEFSVNVNYLTHHYMPCQAVCMSTSFDKITTTIYWEGGVQIRNLSTCPPYPFFLGEP